MHYFMVASSRRIQNPLMYRAQTPFLQVAIRDVSRITSRALHLDFDPVRSTKFEVSLDGGPSEVIHLFKQVPAAIVEVSLPMPRRVSTRARGAENEELRIGRSSGFLNVTVMLTIRRLKILGRQDHGFHVVNLDSRFIERRVWDVFQRTTRKPAAADRATSNRGI
jgi:hypothetical protein